MSERKIQFCCSHKSIHMNLLVVGDGCVGKTSLFIVYARNKFPKEYIPTVYEYDVVDAMVDEIPVAVALWDTGGGVRLIFALVM